MAKINGINADPIFEMRVSKFSKGGIVQTFYDEDPEVIIPLLMNCFIQGIRANNVEMRRTFELLKSVVESVEMNLPLDWRATPKNWRPEK